MKLYLVRHGETEWNRKKIFQGKGDSPLTDIGMEQAIMLGTYIKEKEIKIDEIYSSPLGRAKYTAELIFPEKNILLDERIQEMGFGSWEGKNILEIQKYEGENYHNFFHNAHLYKNETHEGESFKSVENRVKSFLNDLISKYENKTVIVISHGLLLKVLLMYIKGENLQNFWKSEVLNNTSLSLISYDKTWEINFISNMEHLPDELQTSWVPR